MPVTECKIVDRGDPPPFEYPEDTEFRRGNMDRLAVLQGGMASGNASVMIIVHLPDGSVAAVETSAVNFYNAACVVKGACLRWGQEL